MTTPNMFRNRQLAFRRVGVLFVFAFILVLITTQRLTHQSQAASSKRQTPTFEDRVATHLLNPQSTIRKLQFDEWWGGVREKLEMSAAVAGTGYRQPKMAPHSASQTASVLVTPWNTFFHTEGRDIVADSTGDKVAFRGVNLNGLEFGTLFNNRPANPYPGVLGTHYFQPRREDFVAVKNYGFNLVRVPFEWARLVPGWQPPTLPTALNQDYLGLLDQVVNLAAEQQIYVVLDMHDFLKYWCGPACPTKLQECVDDTDPTHPYQRLLERTWKLLAAHFRENRAVLGYDIMNEPERFGQGACRSDNWHAIAQAVVEAIRTEDTKHLIFVEGLNFSLASHWPVENGKQPFIVDRVNSMVPVTPPRIVYSPHVFFDFNNFSLYNDPNEQTGPIGQWQYYVRDRLLPVIDWSKDNNVPIYFGEMGVPCTAAWAQVLDYALINFVEPLRLSVTAWHYTDPDPQRCPLSQCPLNLAACEAKHQLEVLRKYPGGVYASRERMVILVLRMAGC